MDYRNIQSSFKLSQPQSNPSVNKESVNSQQASKTTLKGQKSAGRRVAENNFLLISGQDDNALNMQQPIRNSLIALSHESGPQSVAAAHNKSTDRNQQANYYGASSVPAQNNNDAAVQMFQTSLDQRQLLVDKLPQRPETSTGSKAKQVLLYQQQQTNKKKALQQVYGQTNNMAQRRDSSIDQLSAKSRSNQSRAQSLTNAFSRKDKKDTVAQSVNNTTGKYPPQSQQVPFYNNNILQAGRATAGAAGDLATEPSTHLHQQLSAIRSGEGFLESPQRPADSHQVTTTQSSAAGTANASASYGQSSAVGTRLRMQNLGQVSELGGSTGTNQGVSQSTRLDLNQLLYFQNAQLAQNESRRTSHGGTALGSNNGLMSEKGAPSSHLITITNQQADLPTPLSLSFKNANQSKKLRNLKNFSAQSAAIHGSAAAHEANGILTSLQQPQNQPIIAAQNLMQSFKLGELKNHHQNVIANGNVIKQSSVKNVRRNTQTHTTSKTGQSQIVQLQPGPQGQMAGPLCQIAGVAQPKGGGGSRYKSNKQAAGTAKKMSGTGAASNKSTTMALYTQSVGTGQQRGTSQGANGEVRSGHKGKSFVHAGGAQGFFEGKRIYSTNQPRAQSLVNQGKQAAGRQSFKHLQDFHEHHQMALMASTGDHQQDMLIAQYKSAQPPPNINLNMLRNSVQQDNFFQQASAIHVAPGSLTQQGLKPKSIAVQNLIQLTQNGNIPPSQLSSKSHAHQASGTTSNMSGLVTVPQSTAVPHSAHPQQLFVSQQAAMQYSHQLLQNQAPRGQMRNQNKTLGQPKTVSGGGSKILQSASQSTSGASGNYSRKLTTNNPHGSLQQQYQALNDVANVISGAISQAQGAGDANNNALGLPEGSISAGYSLAQQSKNSSAAAKYSEEIKSLKSTLIQSQSPTFVKSGGNICLGMSSKRAGTAAGNSHQQSLKQQTRLSHNQRIKPQGNERYNNKEHASNHHLYQKDKKRDPTTQAPKSPKNQFHAYLGEETTDQRVSHAISYHAQGVNERRPMTTTHGATSAQLASESTSPPMMKHSKKHLLSQTKDAPSGLAGMRDIPSRASRKSLAEPKLKHSSITKEGIPQSMNPKKAKAANLEAQKRIQENNWVSNQHATVGPKPTTKIEKNLTPAQMQSQVYKIYNQQQKVPYQQALNSKQVVKGVGAQSACGSAAAVSQTGPGSSSKQKPQQYYVYQEPSRTAKMANGTLLSSAQRAATPGRGSDETPQPSNAHVPVKTSQQRKQKIVKLQQRTGGSTNVPNALSNKTRKDFAKIIQNQRMVGAQQAGLDKSKTSSKNKNRFSQEFGGSIKDGAHRRQGKPRSGAVVGGEAGMLGVPSQYSVNESMEDTATVVDLLMSKERRGSNTANVGVSEQDTPLSSSSPTIRKKQTRQNYPSSLQNKNPQFMVNSLDNYAEMMLEHDLNRNNIPLRNLDKGDLRPGTEISKSNPSQGQQLRNYIQSSQDKGRNVFANNYVNFRNGASRQAQLDDHANIQDTEEVGKEGDLIKIQDNNFSNAKHQQVLSEQGVPVEREVGNLGLNWAQSNLNGVVKSSQSQKRLNAMRKQLNQNRLKDIPRKIHPQATEGTERSAAVGKSHDMQRQPLEGVIEERIILDAPQVDDAASSQVKKPPQIPSLASKIQQAQKHAQRQLPGGQVFSEDPSAGVSAVSTIGGVTGLGAQAEQATTGVDYSSNNNAGQSRGADYDHHMYRKNSSILSTANRNHFLINTPSALGYTSVLLGGTNNTGAPATVAPVHAGLGSSFSYNIYGGQHMDDPELLAQQLLFDNDRNLLDQYRQNEEFKAAVDPLGRATEPFMALPYEVRLQNYVDSDDEAAFDSMPWELETR